MMELEEMIDKIKTAYNIAYKEKCEKCRYHKFSEEMNKLNYSSGMLEELKQEMIEQHDYEKNKWTKVAQSIITKFLPPLITTILGGIVLHYVKEKLYTDLIVLIANVVLYGFLILAVLNSIIIVNDVMKDKHKILIRFLQKYIREKRLTTP